MKKIDVTLILQWLRGQSLGKKQKTRVVFRTDPTSKRVPNRFFGIRDLAYFKAGIRDFEGKGGRDSGL